MSIALGRHSVPLATASADMGHSDARPAQEYYIDFRIADTKKAVEGVPEIGAVAPNRTTTHAG